MHHGLTKEYIRLLIEKGLMEYLDDVRTWWNVGVDRQRYLHIYKV
jgi:hypothetical protein